MKAVGRVQNGDLWALGAHWIICGDNRDPEVLARIFAGDRARLAITSPPYNQRINKFKGSGMQRGGNWCAKLGKLAYQDDLLEGVYQARQREALFVWERFMHRGASLFYNHKNRWRDRIMISPLAWLPGPFLMRQEIVWQRAGSVTQNARMFLPCDERIFWMYKAPDFFFDDSKENKNLSSVWKIAQRVNSDHPAPFPIEIPMRCIRACSRRDDAVFEPHLGGGTTLIACEKAGRRCFAIEIEPAFVELAIRKWEESTGRTARLARRARAVQLRTA